VELQAQTSTASGTIVRCRRVVTLLGSRSGCKVVLKNRLISPIHVAIVHTGEAIFALDLLTRQGTRLNGLKLEHERLNDADRLAIGPWELLVRLRDPEQDHTADVHPFDLEPTPQVIALEHVDTERIMHPNRDVCLIGRRPGCDITVEDKTVSRTHALVFRYHGYPVVFDLLSRNGTLVNDQRVRFRIVKDRDIITVGEARFRVRLMGPGSSGLAASSEGVRLVRGKSSDDPSAEALNLQSTQGPVPWKVADPLPSTAPNT
jgi:pSer/pThr/pTyr-binding forkhead associated (FHA) protein